MPHVNGDTPGTIYLLHFDPPYKHARHYLGWTNRPKVRIAAHLTGKGSPLVAAAVAAGSTVTIVKTWPGTRRDEAAIKARKDSLAICPTCQEERRAAKAAWAREYRRRKFRERHFLMRALRPEDGWTWVPARSVP